MSQTHKSHKKHREPKNHQSMSQQTKPKQRVYQQQIEYPEHLSKVNYMAAESLESSLQDHTSYKAYYEAIMDNRHLFQGKIVLHLTEGINCLYSFFALQAGSKKVYCVINGQSERELQNIYMMKEIVKQNNKEDQIIVLNWNNFNAQVDIIIGQPMGYCMHFDGMLDRIIQARDMFLNKKGLVFPNTLIYKCAIIHDQYYQDHKIQFWNDVYGIPMTTMKKWVSRQPLIRIVDPSLIVSKVAKLFTFNLQTVTYNEIIKIDRVFQTEFLSECKANGIVFWFEAIFDHGLEKKDIKASPWVDSTKYTQSTLYWPNIESYKGGSVRVRVQGKKYPHEGYSIITTEVDNKKYQYSFS